MKLDQARPLVKCALPDNIAKIAGIYMPFPLSQSLSIITMHIAIEKILENNAKSENAATMSRLEQNIRSFPLESRKLHTCSG